MVATAKIKMVRMTPRKMRIVANEIRGKHIGQAIDFLTLSKKSAARPLLKLI